MVRNLRTIFLLAEQLFNSTWLKCVNVISIYHTDVTYLNYDFKTLLIHLTIYISNLKPVTNKPTSNVR